MRGSKWNEAFTLVELMLVVVIIGILAGVVLPKLVGSQERAKIEATRGQIRIFETAIDIYHLEVGKAPESLKDLVVNPGESKWNGPYLNKKTLPKDPWENQYVYDPDGTRGITYDVYSWGPDGVDGTDDDIGNWDASENTGS